MRISLTDVTIITTYNESNTRFEEKLQKLENRAIFTVSKHRLGLWIWFRREPVDQGEPS